MTHVTWQTGTFPPESDSAGLKQGPGICMFLQAPYEIFMTRQMRETLI